MTYYDELYMKLTEIKFHCDLQPNCINCPFSKGEEFKYCRLDCAPYEWDLDIKGVDDGKN